MSAQSGAKRILLLGYYGFGNAGDEAVLAGLISSLQSEALSVGANIEIGVLSIDPESTTRDHGVKAFHRYRIKELIAGLKWCDLFAEGGGSLLQDVTSARSIYYYLAVVRLAQFMGKKTMFIAQGIGPLDNKGSRNFTASVAKRCNAITVRDEGSADLLAEIGVPREKVTVTADPALVLGNLSKSENGSSEVLISLRPWKGQEKVIATLTDALKSSPIQPTDIAPITCSNEDLAPLKELGVLASVPSLQDAKRMTHGEIIQVMPVTRLVIGMRLHSLILAASCGVPSVALSYDPKVHAFMQQCGQGDAVFDIRQDDSQTLAALITKTLVETDSRGAALQNSIPSLINAAQSNASIAIDLVLGDK